MKTCGIQLLLIVAASAPAAGLAELPPNTWVKLLEAETGAREQPVFVYASTRTVTNSASVPAGNG